MNPDVFKMPPSVLKRKASADLGEVQHLKKKKKKKPNVEWNFKWQGSSSEVENSSFRIESPFYSPKSGWLTTKMRE